MNSGLLFDIFVFLAAACVVVPLASRFKLGSVLGYLTAGILIGPFGLGWIENGEQVMHFAEFGVVMLLFLIGLELEPATVWRMRRAIVGMGGLQVVLTTAVLAAGALALGFETPAALGAAMALSLSSTALVLQMLQEKNLMQTSVGETAFAVLLFQDIAVIPMLILIPLLAGGGDAVSAHHTGPIANLPAWAHALAVAGVITLVVVAGRYFSRHVFYFIAKTRLREVFTATSLALVVGVTLLMQLVGVSPALGAFVAGLMLANSPYKHTLETDLEPFKALLLGLFFISVGMSMDFALLDGHSGQVLALVVGLMMAKAAVLFVLGRLFGLIPLHNTGLAMALCQGGEFAFVLFQFAAGLDILSADQSALLTLAVALSMMLTPLLMLAYNRFLVPRFMSVLPERSYDVIDANHRIILAGYGRVGQIIGRFLMAQGVKVTILEKDPDQIDALRKFGFKGYFGDAARLDLLRSAQAEQATMLVVAVDDPDTSLQIVRLAKEEFPHLRIFARARNRRHAYELNKAGVEYFKRETFDSSLAMAQDIMMALGCSNDEVRANAARFAQHDEETLRASFAFYESEPDLVSFSRLRAEELERILQSDETPAAPR